VSSWGRCPRRFALAPVLQRVYRLQPVRNVTQVAADRGALDERPRTPSGSFGAQLW